MLCDHCLYICRVKWNRQWFVRFLKVRPTDDLQTGTLLLLYTGSTLSFYTRLVSRSGISPVCVVIIFNSGRLSVVEKSIRRRDQSELCVFDNNKNDKSCQLKVLCSLYDTTCGQTDRHCNDNDEGERLKHESQLNVLLIPRDASRAS